ncbi:MAG: kdsD [Magnetococcales bacterium]|nr:kdsD [Magnetococcales bacterium]
MSTLKTDLTVANVMLPAHEIPVAPTSTILKEILDMMGRYRLGIVCITNQAGKLEGVFTDGDVRRLLLKDQKPFAALFNDDIGVHITKNCTTTTADAPLTVAVDVMGSKRIWDLPVVGQDGVLVGLLHLHPAVSTLLDLRKRQE